LTTELASAPSEKPELAKPEKKPAFFGRRKFLIFLRLPAKLCFGKHVSNSGHYYEFEAANPSF